jgi:hypothetical protein
VIEKISWIVLVISLNYNLLYRLNLTKRIGYNIENPQMKTQTTTIVLLFISNLLFAQDVITLTNGETIYAKVTEVGEKSISFRKINNLNGPLFTKDRANVHQIKFENGDIEIWAKLLASADSTLLSHSRSNPNSLLAKGNYVFVEIPNDASRAGEKYFVELLQGWKYWNVVTDIKDAHFIIEFNIEKKMMLDKSSWLVFKTIDGSPFKESRHYRETTNAWNGYNAFKGAAERVFKKYLDSGDFKK